MNDEDNVRMARALMKAYRFTRDHLTECIFCGSAIDLDCYHNCVMQIAEQTLIDAGDDPSKWMSDSA